MGKKFDQPTAEEDPADLNLLEASELAALLEAKWRDSVSLVEVQTTAPRWSGLGTDSNEIDVNRDHKPSSLKRLLETDALIGVGSVGLKSRDNLVSYLIASGVDSREIDGILPAVVRAISEVTESFQEAAVGYKSTRDQTIELPDKAPELYQGKRSGEDIAEFLGRVWKPWIEAGVLTRHNLKDLDKKAYNAVVNWTAKMPLPNDVALPTRTDTINAEFRIGELSRDEMVEKMRESERLASALRRRLDLM